MSASQLLRILQTLPTFAYDEISDFSMDELEASTKRGSRSTYPFLSNGEENEVKFWNNRPELEMSTFGNELTNNHDDVPFRWPPECAQTTGFHIDKHLVECDLPELIVCYKDKESDFQVKDISIDEGISDEETISTPKDNNHEFIYHNSDLVNDDDDDMIEARLDTEFLKHDQWLRSSTMACCYKDADLDSPNYEEKLNLSTNVQDDVNTDQLAFHSKISLQQDWSQKPLEFPVSSNLYYDDINQLPLQGSKDKLGKRAIVGSIAKKQNNTFNESKIEEGVTFHFDTRKTKDSNRCGSLNPESTELPLETESVVNQHEAASASKVALKDQETRCAEGEASFSMAGVISELISCSRPMPLVGGISTRSDSSANSTRSFAFPTLETEYASSPVRMVKGNRSRLQKRGRWRKGLLCCKF